MITSQIAETFTSQWIDAWNSHEMEKILEHYADDVQFSSPLITLLEVNAEGIIKGKDELRQYFELGLKVYPHLRFTLHHCLPGVDSLVIYYESVNGRMAAEVFQLNDQAKAVKVQCHYAATTVAG